MEAGVHGPVIPGAGGVGCGVYVGAMTVQVRKDVEGILAIAKAGRPEAPVVGVFPVFQTKFGPEVKTILCVTEERPVDQVPGIQNRQAWHGMHGGTGQVVIIPYPNHIGIGKFLIEQGGGECPVTVVGYPGAVFFLWRGDTGIALCENASRGKQQQNEQY